MNNSLNIEFKNVQKDHVYKMAILHLPITEKTKFTFNNIIIIIIYSIKKKIV